MKLFCRVRIETVEIESLEAPMEAWREMFGGEVLTEHVNGSKD